MRIEAILRGGMGVVYICRYLTYDEITSTPGSAKSLYFEGSIHRRIADEYGRVAIKSFLGSVWHTSVAERFAREANLWLSLPPHPHIVAARWFEPSRLVGMGGALLALEYVDGGTLRSRLKGESLPESETLRIALEFCAGMTFLFETAAIVHRDIKPANILLTRSGTVKITDLGLARAFDERSTHERAALEKFLAQLTPLDRDARIRAGVGAGLSLSWAGTPHYMSPEQWAGSTTLTTTADVYAFGVVLYEMLTGSVPFRTTDLLELGLQHMRAAPAAPRTISAAVDHRLSAIAMKCLEKVPEHRFTNFAELRNALESYARSVNVPVPSCVSKADLEAPMTALDWRCRGLAWHRLRDKERTLDCATRALEIDPHVSHLRLDLSAALYQAGRHAESSAHEEREEALYPLNPEFHQQMAIKFTALGRPLDALAAARRAVELGRDVPAAWELLVLCAGAVAKGAEGKDYAQAAAGLLVCFEANPNSTMYEWMAMACSFGARKHYFVAAQLHGACVRRFPDAAVNWYNFGVTWHRMGRLDGARDCYAKAIQLEPSSVLALVNRGWIHFERGDLPAAQRDWESAVAVDPEHAACGVVSLSLGVGLQKLMNNSELVSNFKKLGRDMISLAYHL